jgi:hypothetical protein
MTKSEEDILYCQINIGRHTVWYCQRMFVICFAVSDVLIGEGAN